MVIDAAQPLDAVAEAATRALLQRLAQHDAAAGGQDPATGADLE
jgi:hypothetical protein